jgi:hypothetical protein
MIQEPFDVLRRQLARMALSGEDDVASYPIDIGFLRSQGIVQRADASANDVEEARAGWRGWGGEEVRANLGLITMTRIGKDCRFRELRSGLPRLAGRGDGFSCMDRMSTFS